MNESAPIGVEPGFAAMLPGLFFILIGLLFVAFANGFNNFQIRIMEWQLRILRNRRWIWIYRFFGALFVTFGAWSLVMFFRAAS